MSNLMSRCMNNYNNFEKMIVLGSSGIVILLFIIMVIFIKLHSWFFLIAIFLMGMGLYCYVNYKKIGKSKLVTKLYFGNKKQFIDTLVGLL